MARSEVPPLRSSDSSSSSQTSPAINAADMAALREQLHYLNQDINQLRGIIETQKQEISYFEHKFKDEAGEIQNYTDNEYKKLQAAERERDIARAEVAKLQEQINQDSAGASAYIKDLIRQGQRLQAERDELQREVTEHRVRRANVELQEAKMHDPAKGRRDAAIQGGPDVVDNDATQPPVKDCVEQLEKCKATIAMYDQHSEEFMEAYEKATTDRKMAIAERDQARVGMEKSKMEAATATAELDAFLSAKLDQRPDEHRETELAALQAQLDISIRNVKENIREKNQAINERRIANRQLEGMIKAREAAVLERDQGRAELEKALAQGQAIRQKFEQVLLERSIIELTELGAELDEAQARMTELTQQRHRASDDLESTRFRLEIVKNERDQAVIERDQAIAERDQALNANRPEENRPVDSDPIDHLPDDQLVEQPDGEENPLAYPPGQDGQRNSEGAGADEDENNKPQDDCEIRLAIAQAALDTALEESNQARRDLATRTAERNGNAHRVQVLEAEAVEAQDREIDLREVLRRDREENPLTVALDQELVGHRQALQDMTNARDAALSDAARSQQELDTARADTGAVRAALREANNRLEIQRREVQRLQDAQDNIIEGRNMVAIETAEYIRRAETALEAANTATAALRSEYDSALETIERLSRTAQNSMWDLEDCREGRGNVEAEIERLTRDNDALTEQAGVPQAVLDDAIAERDQAQREVERLLLQLDALNIAASTATTGREACTQTDANLNQEPEEDQARRSGALSPEEALSSVDVLKDIMAGPGSGPTQERPCRAATRLANPTPGTRTIARSTRNPAPFYDAGSNEDPRRSRKRKAAGGEKPGGAKKKR